MRHGACRAPKVAFSGFEARACSLEFSSLGSAGFGHPWGLQLRV